MLINVDELSMALMGVTYRVKWEVVGFFIWRCGRRLWRDNRAACLLVTRRT